jgi:hypothetical protein
VDQSGAVFDELVFRYVVGKYWLDDFKYEAAITPVPEPATMLLLRCGIIEIGCM